MQTRNYSIHNLINFQIRNNTNRIWRHFDTTQIQFSNFVCDDNYFYDFTVEIGPFERQQNECVIIDDTYYIADDYFFFSDKRKLAKWKVEISNIEKSPKIKIETNFVGNITSSLNIIEFFIQYSLLKKGVSLIHASGIGLNNECILFPARSGGGKTTVALSLLDRNSSYLGDNFIILDKGVARSYICPLNIFTYNRLPIIENNLTNKQRFHMYLKKILYSVTRGNFKMFEKINPENLFKDKIQHQLKTGLICLLEVNDYQRESEFIVQSISREMLIKKLRYNMELDLLPFSKYIYSYGYMYPDGSFAEFWDIYERNLEYNLPDNINAISINAPIRWTESKINELIKLIEERQLSNILAV